MGMPKIFQEKGRLSKHDVIRHSKFIVIQSIIDNNVFYINGLKTSDKRVGDNRTHTGIDISQS